MGLLKQFQNETRSEITTKFRELCQSISEAFEGNAGRFDNETRFTFKLHGLTAVSIWLYIDHGYMEVTIDSVDLGFGYGDLDKVETYETDRYSQRRRTGTDKKALAKLVKAKIKLESEWDFSVVERYTRIIFKKTVSKMDDKFLRDLVKLMERAGYAPRVEARRTYF